MGANPHIQAKVQRELDDVLGPDLECEVAYEQLGELRYVEACLKETLRSVPPPLPSTTN